MQVDQAEEDDRPPDSATRWAAMNFSFSVTPRPGRSGTEIQPSTAWMGSFVSWCRRGESSTQSSNKNASRQVLSQCKLAAAVTGLV